jgi:SAM-dependent methyltransferase
MNKKTIPFFVKKIIKNAYAGILYIYFIIDFIKFKKNIRGNYRFKILWKNRYPQLLDKNLVTPFDSHYIYHPAWAARIIRQINPKLHIDISSTLYFSSIISAFVPVHFYDYRPANIILNNLKTGKADLMSLPFSDKSIESISCMHTIEHIGLGRYGDKIDPDGDLKAIGELKRVLAPGGSLLFVVPMGKPKIMFNAHRIYSYDQIISYFNDMELKEFSLIPDNAQEVGMIKDATKEIADLQNYGCGCFWFTK